MNTATTTTTSTRSDDFKIRYNKFQNWIEVKGNSNNMELTPTYVKLMDSTRKHLSYSNTLTCTFNYTWLNASTLKFLFTFFKEVQKESKRGKSIIINWVIEDQDEDLFKIGLDFKDLFNLKMDFVII